MRRAAVREAVSARRYRTRVTRTEWIAALQAEGWFVTEWSDDPNTRYAAHAHRATEVRVVLEGSMTIVIDGTSHEVRAGERFDVAPDVQHEATVGPHGVTYLAGAMPT